MNRLFQFLFVVGLVVLFSSPASAEGLKVGTLFDHSGALKDWGLRHQNAADLAGEQMATAGLTLEFVHEDSQTAAEPAEKAARKLIETDKVAAIVGSSSSGVIVPVAETVTCPEDVLMITPGATSPFITDLPEDKGKDLLFRTCPSDALQGAVLGRLAAGLYKTASVMYVNNPYGQGLAEQFRRSFIKHGGTVYAMIPHAEAVAQSYAAELRNAYARMYSIRPFRSGRSDVLCVFSYPEHAKIYVKEAIEIYDAKHFLFCDGTKSEELAAAVGPEKLEGMMGTAPGVPAGEASLKFTADYTAKFGELPKSPFIANAYDATAVIGLAAFASATKGLEPTSKNIRDHLREVANPPGAFVGPGEFRKAFELLKTGQPINYEGASGPIDFDANGDVLAPIEIWRFHDGKIATYRMEYYVEKE
jgi:ABC-type branched-subunit amino acid transport system substrate-binding protein